MKPTIGRIVHYTLSENDVKQFGVGSGNVKAGDTFPAIILRAWGSDPTSAVNLRVFVDGPSDIWLTSRTGAPGDQINVPGQWNWPPREGS